MQGHLLVGSRSALQNMDCHLPQNVVDAHEACVMSISVKPSSISGEIFLTASQDGYIKLWDLRCPQNNRAVNTDLPRRYQPDSNISGGVENLAAYLHFNDELAAVEWSPHQEMQFITGDSSSNLVLWDARFMKSPKTHGNSLESKSDGQKFKHSLLEVCSRVILIY